jgi:hypothetical protein
MTQEEVVKLMESSKSEKEWDDNCDTVKKAHAGRYPEFWFVAILLSGVANRVMSSWKKQT